MPPPVRKTPPTCGYPVGGTNLCGADAAWQVPWKALYGYAERAGQLPLCTQHASRFPDVAPL